MACTRCTFSMWRRNMSMSQVSVEGDVKPRFFEAFEKLSGEIRAMPKSDFTTINLDVPTAVATALGILPAVKALRDRAAVLPGLDVARFDRLEDYTLALAHAHGAYLVASSPPRSLEDLGDEATRVRDLLLSDANALANRGLLDG